MMAKLAVSGLSTWNDLLKVMSGTKSRYEFLISDTSHTKVIKLSKMFYARIFVTTSFLMLDIGLKNELSVFLYWMPESVVSRYIKKTCRYRKKTCPFSRVLRLQPAALIAKWFCHRCSPGNKRPRQNPRKHLKWRSLKE